MRTSNPYPWGHAPLHRDVEEAAARAVGGALLRADGTRVASLGMPEIAAIPTIARVREGEPPFDQVYGRLLSVALDGPAGRVATLRIAEDGAIHFQGAAPQDAWNGFASAEDPRAVLAWLAKIGAPEPLARWDASQGEAGARALAAWRAAIPLTLVASVDDALAAPVIPPAFAQGAVDRLEAALGSRPAALAALLAWYGAGDGPLALRGDHERLVRLLLSRFGFDEVVQTFAALTNDSERAGAGRYVLDAAPLPPVLATTIAAVPEAAREALVTALAPRSSNDDAGTLRELLFPAPAGAPAGTTLVGLSNTVHLRRPVTDGRALFAIDGTEVARFEDGKRTAVAMLLREAPLAVHDGVLLWRTGAVIQRRTLDGAPLPNAQAPTAAETEAARARSTAWGNVTPPAPGLVAIAPPAHDIEAFESFAHLGLPPPASARVAGRAFLDVDGAALVRTTSSTPERLALPGKPLVVAVGSTAIHVLAEVADGLVIASVPDAGEVHLSAKLAISAPTVAFFLTSEGAVFLGIDTGSGIVVARKALE